MSSPAGKLTPERLAQIRARTVPHDSAKRLTTAKGKAAYLNAALQEGDPSGITMALEVLARAKHMTERPKAADLSQETKG